jgi:hypothetical protein
MPNGQLKVLDEHPLRLNGLSKRGIWTYSLGKFKQCKSDNGIVYNRVDFEAFIKLRGVGLTKTTPYTVETPAD